MKIVIAHKKKKIKQKGVALVIAMLMAAMLSIAGVIAINNTRFEIQSSALIRQSEQTGKIAESGLTIGTYTFSNSYDAYERFMKKNNLKRLEIRMSDLEASGVEIFNPPQGGIPGTFGWITPIPSFIIQGDRAVESLPVTGFSLPGSNSPYFCFKKYRFSSIGRLIYPEDINRVGLSERGYRAFIIIGPIQCTQ